MVELVTSWWGEGDERHAGTDGPVNIRKIPDRELLLRVFCDTGRHLVAVIRRGRPPMLVTVRGTSGLDRRREIVCRCRQDVILTDPTRLSAEVDPATPRPRVVRATRVSLGG